MLFTSNEIVDRSDVSLSPQDRLMVITGLVKKEMQRIQKEGSRDDKRCLGNFKVLERVLEVLSAGEVDYPIAEGHLKLVLGQFDRDSQHPKVNLSGVPTIRASLISYMVNMGTSASNLTAKALESAAIPEPSPGSRKAVIDAARPALTKEARL